MIRVAINIVTYNSAEFIDACLESVFSQSFTNYQVTVIDNGSQDDTVSRLSAWEPRGVRIILNEANLYYSRAHNSGIRESDSEFVMVLNPDVVLSTTFLTHVIAALDRFPQVGSVNGRLIRVKPGELRAELMNTPLHPDAVLDGAGLMMYRSRRPDLRGNNKLATKNCIETAFIFGVDAACAVYRRAMLDDIAIEGEYFDEDFQIYREDVDVAWRAQLRGWDCLYVPDALAYHIRTFRPGQRRRGISKDLKRHSVKNGWMLVIKNEVGISVLRDLPYVLGYQLKVAFGLVFLEPASLGAIPSTLRLLPKMLRKRRHIQSRRTRSTVDLCRWFV